jgi:hypothetical protein
VLDLELIKLLLQFLLLESQALNLDLVGCVEQRAYTLALLREGTDNRMIQNKRIKIVTRSLRTIIIRLAVVSGRVRGLHLMFPQQLREKERKAKKVVS